MTSLIFSINSVMPLFLLVLLGYVLKRIGIFTDEWLKMANNFSFKITLSVMLFYEIFNGGTSSKASTKLILFSVIIVFVITILSYIFVPFLVKDRFRTGVVIQGIFRSNYLLFGMPLVINMFGNDGKIISATMVAIIIPIYNIFAVITLTIFNKNSNGKISILKLLKAFISNPLLVGCIFGYGLKAITPTLPIFMMKTLGEISNIAVPLALIILGGQFKVTSLLKNIKTVSVVVFIKLLAIPFVVLIVAINLGFRGVELGVIIAIFSSPGAVSSSIMAYSMDCDGDLAGQIVVLGTIVSLVSMFFTIFALKAFSLI